MAIGLKPRHTAIQPLGGMAGGHYLSLIVETAGRLGWPIHYVSAAGLVAMVQAKQASELQIRIGTDAATITSRSIHAEFFDGGRNRRNVALFIATLTQLRETLPFEHLAWRYEQLQHFLPEADAFASPRLKNRSQAGDVLAIFKPAGGYFITPIILNLNILMFLLMALCGVNVLSPDTLSLIRWGANLGILTIGGGEWWRLLSSTFLHIGAMHLFMNMYAFLLIGTQLEPRLGKLRFLTAYLISGVVASFTSVSWHGDTISAGASGAIFGMYGVFLALLTTSLVKGSNKKQLLASILFFVVYNLLNGLQPGIDNAAHIGGLLSGLLIGYGFIPGLRKGAGGDLPVEGVQLVKDEPAEYY